MAHVAVGELSRWARVPRRVARADGGARSVSFPELAYLHLRWRKALDGNVADLDERSRRYHAARAAFEREQGTIVSEYWCWNVPSAVALTETARPPVVRWFLRPKLAFHRASDWATRNQPDVAAQLHRCDDLAVRATQVLSGLRRRICLELVTASAEHLLSFVDAKAAHEEAAGVLEHETQTLDDTERYYRDAANGQAQIVYFAGMAGVAVAVCAFALIGNAWINLPGVVEHEFYGCLAAGALGAVVSVIQRINSGQFDLTYDVGRPYLTFLGGLRPVIGAVFGLVFYFATAGGILRIFAIPHGSSQTTARLFTYLVIAFLAGFSERWAQDTLTALGQAKAAPEPRAKAAGPREPGERNEERAR